MKWVNTTHEIRCYESVLYFLFLEYHEYREEGRRDIRNFYKMLLGKNHNTDSLILIIHQNFKGLGSFPYQYPFCSYAVIVNSGQIPHIVLVFLFLTLIK